MSDEPLPPASAELDEQLVAYLDGELSAEESRRVEDLLARNESVRGRLRALQHAWDALGALDRAGLPPDFTKTTMELVAVAATEEDQRRRRWLAPWRLGRAAAWLAALAAAALVGFVVAYTVAGRPNRQLLDDLPVVQRLDQYRQIESVDFLRQLHREKLFDADRAAASE